MSSSFRYVPALRRAWYTAIQEEAETRAAANTSWSIPPPASTLHIKPRRVRVRVVNPAYARSTSCLGSRGLFSRCCAFLGGLFAVCVVFIFLGPEETNWAPTFRDSTLVFSRDELQRIWRWEIDSGHHPSNARSKSPRFMGIAYLPWPCPQYPNR